MRRIIPLAAVAGFVFSTVWWYHAWEHWISYGTGSYNCTPRLCPNGVIHNYNFNSGFGSIIEPWILQILSAIVLLWWHQQCHVSGCYWPGLPHRTDAGDRACWRHHPNRHMTAEHMHRRHHAARSGQPIPVVPVADARDGNVSDTILAADRSQR